MNILAISPTFFPIVGGAELLITDVLNTWSRDHEVRLLTPYLPKTSEPFWVPEGRESHTCEFEVKRFEDRFNMLKLRGHSLTHGLLPPMSVSAVSALKREARDLGADMMVGFFGIPYGLSLSWVSARLGIPYSLVLCGTDLPSPRTKSVPFWSDYLRLAVERASKAVYVSRFCFDLLYDREIEPEHDRVIVGGVRREESVPTSDRTALRASLGIGPDDIMLFALQRLGPEKRVDVIIRAFAQLPTLPKKVKLVIGGQGSEYDSLRRLAAELGVDSDVVWTGHLGVEKKDYYEACDIFVFHSMFETFGQVLVEAMNAGKPVVSTRAGAIPEVIDEGVTGLLVEPMDSSAMAERIAGLVRDPAARIAMGEAGSRRVEGMFDWANVRQLWIDLLDTGDMAEPSVVPSGKGVRSGAGS